jgi:hypothetical protein
LADGFDRMARKSNSFSLFLRYKAQAELQYRRAIEEFDRLKKLRPELRNEPILETQPEENEPDSTPPEEPVSNPTPNPDPHSPESTPESHVDTPSGEAPSVSEGAASPKPEAAGVRCRISKNPQALALRKPIPINSRLLPFVRRFAINKRKSIHADFAGGTSQAHTGYTNCNGGRVSSRLIAINYVHMGILSGFHILLSCRRGCSQSIHRGNGRRSGRGSYGSSRAAGRPSQ